MANNNAINQAQTVLYAYLSSETGAVTGDGTAYTVLFDKSTDTSASYNSGTGLYTIPKTGNWFIGYTIQYDSIASGATTFQSYMAHNGANTYWCWQTRPTQLQTTGFYGINNWVTTQAAMVQYIAAGDTISCVAIGAGGSKNDKIAGSTGAYQPTFMYCFLLSEE